MKGRRESRSSLLLAPLAESPLADGKACGCCF